MSFTGLPWDDLRRWFRTFRRRRFSVPRPEGPYLRADILGNDLRAVLGKASYAPNYELSYDKGEDLNLSQVVWWPIAEWPIEVRNEMREHADLGDGDHWRRAQWWQTHARGWRVGPGVWDLRAHWETEPSENDAAHLAEVGFDVERGMANLRDVLFEAGVTFEEIEWTRGVDS